MIPLKTEVSTLRKYGESGGYDNRKAPEFSCVVHYISDHEVYICNAVGTLSIKSFRDIRKFFVDKGYTIFRYERKLVMKEILA